MSGAMQYIAPILQTAGGAGLTAAAPGNPVGLTMMGSGISSLAGNAAGGSTGQPVGGSAGPLGGLSNALSGVLGGLGMTGAPASSASPQQAGTGQAAPAQGATGTGASSNNGAWVGFGDTAAAYAKYISDRQNTILSERSAYTGEHGTPIEQLPGLNLLAPTPFALPQI